jgi:hypothetical protein
MSNSGRCIFKKRFIDFIVLVVESPRLGSPHVLGPW